MLRHTTVLSLGLYRIFCLFYIRYPVKFAGFPAELLKKNYANFLFLEPFQYVQNKIEILEMLVAVDEN